MQDELVVKEKLSSLGLLAAGMAHEINNPMAFVNINALGLHRRLAAQPQLPDALREYVDDVLSATFDERGGPAALRPQRLGGARPVRPQ